MLITNELNAKPFELETLTGNKTDIFIFDDNYKEIEQINSKSVFNRVKSCFPVLSNFDMDLSFKAGYKTNKTFAGEQDKFYSGIVFKMPLFSSADNARFREIEYKRRQDLSKLINNFISQITKRNLAKRMIGLYKNLEQREQLRVRTGIEHKKGSLITVADQVKYLEKLAKEQQKKYEAIAEIDSIKLQLIAHCQTNKMDLMDIYLTNLINKI